MGVYPRALVAAALACGLSSACGDDDVRTPADAGGGDAAPAVPVAALPELTPCPEGWREAGEDPVLCEPWPESGVATCGDGEAHFVGEEGCTRVGAECPAGDWPADLPADDVLYVDDDAAAGGDGSMGSPYRTVVEAAARATAGATLAVAAGTYDGPVDLRRDVTLVGKCPAEVTITCTTTGCASGIIESSRGAAAVRDVRVTGERPAFWVEGLGELRADGVWIDGTRVGAMVAIGGGRLEVRSVLVQDVRPRASDGTAVAVYVEDATAVLERVVIEGVPDVMINVVGEGAALELRDAVVRDGAGPGVGVSGGARAILERVLFSRASGNAMTVLEAGSSLSLDWVIAEHTQVGAAAAANALDVRSGAHAEARHSWFRGHVTTSVFVGEASQLALTDVVVSDQPSRVAPEAGVGVLGGSSATLERLLVERVATTGIIAQGAGTTATLRDVIVRYGGADEEGFFGRGIDALVGAGVTGERVRVLSVYEVGLLAAGADTRLELTGLVAEHVAERRCATDGCVGLGLGCGVSSIFDASVRLERFQLADNALCGVQLAEGGVADLSDGEVVGNPIGANVQTAGFDLSRIQTDVVYRDNDRNLDTMAMLPAPDPGSF